MTQEDSPSAMMSKIRSNWRVTALQSFLVAVLSLPLTSLATSAPVDTRCQTWVSLSFQNQTLEQVLSSLSDLTGMEVFLGSDLQVARVNFRHEGISIPDALREILDSLRLNYVMVVDPHDTCRVSKIYVGSGGEGKVRPLTSPDEMRSQGADNQASDTTVDRHEDRARSPRTRPNPDAETQDRYRARASEPKQPRPSTPPPSADETSPGLLPEGQVLAPSTPPTEDLPQEDQPPEDQPLEDQPPEDMPLEDLPPDEGDTPYEEPHGQEESPSEESSPSEQDSNLSPEEEERLRRPPSPDPMNLYRYFTGDLRTLTYHRLSCRDAMMVPANFKLWFESEEQARNAGFAPHTCMQQLLPR